MKARTWHLACFLQTGFFSKGYRRPATLSACRPGTSRRGAVYGADDSLVLSRTVVGRESEGVSRHVNTGEELQGHEA